MAAEDLDEQYFIYESRLASFQGPQPVAKHRRTSNANSSRAPKVLTWPHKNLPASDLARAGFYFNPRPSNPDNVRCFLCHKELDGWEEDDDPLAEHLKHSPACGWAICAAIEVELGDIAKEDPRQSYLLDARKATFAGYWPYEGKKGWKCKTKQLAEAGWKYTPTIDSDDHTTCTYCQLALDGWEPSDKPMEEHQKRSPNCPFFALISQGPAPKKSARGKAARASKVSRMSIQSITTAASEVPSVSELHADVDDSILTTTSVMTQGGRKAPKSRKAAATGRGRKTRAKKDEAVEVHEDADVEDADVPPPAPPKPTRGRKRGSDAMEDPAADAEAPAPKKRATRARTSGAAEASVHDVERDVEVSDAPAPAKAPSTRKRVKGTTAKANRKTSAISIASTASMASLRQVPDDDELDRQLQADLERQMDDEDDVMHDSDAEPRKASPSPPPPPPPKARGKRVPSRKVAAAAAEKAAKDDDFAMFDPTPKEPDEEAVDAELHALESEMKIQEQPADEIQVPKKGRKAGVRKASKQVKKGKEAAQAKAEPAAAAAGEPPHPEPEEPARETQPQPPQQQEETVAVDEHHDISVVSTDTVVKGATEAAAPPKRARGRPPKKSKEAPVEPQAAIEPRQTIAEQPVHTVVEVEVESTTVRQSFSAGIRSPGKVVARSPSPPPPPPQPQAKKVIQPQVEKALPPPPPPRATQQALPRPPATPRAHPISATPSAKQATMSPSQSPQSSDAENQPPSSKPSTGPGAKRIVLAPVTPVQNAGSSSPLRRTNANAIGGLRSAMPWTAVDLGLVFGGNEKEKAGAEGGDAGVAAMLLKKDGELSAAEKSMTVEEWIYYNAGQAEQKLKHECEAMVSAFEREGTRAMRVLEELVVD